MTEHEKKESAIAKAIQNQAYFQITMIITFLYRVVSFHPETPRLDNLFIAIPEFLGIIIFGYFLAKIYWINKNKSLITTGLFKYTRHPMYMGIFLADLDTWMTTEYTSGFWLSFLLFVITLSAAAYLQEKEVIARFGKEAEEYYKKTPRLILFYPYFYWKNRKTENH